MLKKEVEHRSVWAVDAMLDVLADEGVSVIFGNPGSTEMPLMDALVDEQSSRVVYAGRSA
jgi:benzoylformate decarboxylase